MMMTLAPSFLTICAFAGVLRVWAWGKGWVRDRFSPTAWLGLLGYAWVHVTLELYGFASTVEAAVRVWQVALIGAVVVFCVLHWLVVGHRQLLHLPAAIACGFAGALVFTTIDQVVVQKLAETGLAVVTVIVSLQVLLLMGKRNALAWGIWGCCVLANAATAAKIYSCQILNDQLHVARYVEPACSQVWGAISLVLPEGVILLWLFYLIVSHDPSQEPG